MNPQTKFAAIRQLPFMPDSEIAYLRECLAECRCYLEYGAGGSTRLAARMQVERIYSVESDLKFAEAVANCIAREAANTRHTMVRVDIGAGEGNWGKPKDNSKARKWPKYASEVWTAIARDNAVPDLILIDGRFRVACFLVSLLCAKPSTKILLDDYVGRETQYSAVERHLKPQALVGRMAVFSVPPEIECRALAFDLAMYSVDPR